MREVGGGGSKKIEVKDPLFPIPHFTQQAYPSVSILSVPILLFMTHPDNLLPWHFVYNFFEEWCWIIVYLFLYYHHRIVNSLGVRPDRFYYTLHPHPLATHYHINAQKNSSLVRKLLRFEAKIIRKILKIKE